MDIHTRQTHLSEMGVPQWHARFVLVGAAESPVAEVSPSEVPVSSSLLHKSTVREQPEKVERTENEAVVAAEVVESLLGEVQASADISTASSIKALTGSQDSDAETVNSVEVSNAVQVNEQTMPELTLGMFVSNDYAVVSEMGSNVSHLEEMELLQNMIKAVDVKCSNFEFVSGFNWPVFSSVKVLVGQNMMHEALIARWLGAYELSKCRVFMCFGEKGKNILADLFNESPEAIAGCEVVFFCDGLTELYKNPLRKKDAWKTLCENVDKFSQSSRE